GVAVWVAPVGGRIVRLRSVLGTAPGTGGARTFRVLVNNSATALEVTYGAAMSGPIEVDVAVDVPRGASVQIESTTNGTAADSLFWSSLVFEATEVALSAY